MNAAPAGDEEPFEVVVGAVQVYEVPGAVGELEVDQDGAVGRELLGPLPRDRRYRAGGDDPVVGGLMGNAVGTVGRDDGGVVAGGGESFGGQGDELGVHVDGEHLAVAEAVGQ